MRGVWPSRRYVAHGVGEIHRLHTGVVPVEGARIELARTSLEVRLCRRGIDSRLTFHRLGVYQAAIVRWITRCDWIEHREAGHHREACFQQSLVGVAGMNDLEPRRIPDFVRVRAVESREVLGALARVVARRSVLAGRAGVGHAEQMGEAPTPAAIDVIKLERMELGRVARDAARAHVEHEARVFVRDLVADVGFNGLAGIHHEYLEAGMRLDHAHRSGRITERRHGVARVRRAWVGAVLVAKQTAVAGIDRRMPRWIGLPIRASGDVGIVDPLWAWLASNGRLDARWHWRRCERWWRRDRRGWRGRCSWV